MKQRMPQHGDSMAPTDLLAAHFASNDAGGDISEAKALSAAIGSVSRAAVKLPSRHINSHIPAGYTYLAQLLVHDLVSNRQRLPSGMAPHHLIDVKQCRLDLDCVYGGGPGVSPWLYRSDGTRFDTRYQFALGQTRPKPQGRAMPRWADIPRTVVDSPVSASAPPCHDPLIADIRNEDNLILSQLVVLFLKAHNLIVERTMADDKRSPSAMREAFNRAHRWIVTSYRQIVLHDLAPKLLCDTVYQRLSRLERGKPLYAISLRYPRALIYAMRVGHAMVRDAYDYNAHFALAHDGTGAELATLRGLVGAGSPHTPLSDDWVIDWRRFFFTPPVEDSTTVNFSRPIHPQIAGALDRSTRREFQKTLSFIDFSRATDDEIPLAQTLAESYGIEPLSSEVILDWLIGLDAKPIAGLTAEKIERLSTQTPLLFYLLCEAGSAPNNGLQLGELGSILIGELLFLSTYDEHESMNEQPQDGLVAHPRSMLELLEFVETHSTT